MFMSLNKAFSQKDVNTFRKKPAFLTVVFLVLATLLTYGNSLFNGFVWDDRDIIVNNTVNRDIDNFSSLFSSADSTVSGNQQNYYRPLNRLTYMLDYQMFGLRPAWYHLENVIIHLITVILFYLVARRLITETVPAFIAALIFAVHPVNAEAVNFLSTRNSLLSALFVLLTLITYFHAGAAGKRPYYYLSGLFFLMGLLCKEQAIMLPCVLLMFEMTRDQADGMSARARISPLLVFVPAIAIYLALRYYALPAILGGHGIVEQIWERLLQNIYIIPKYALTVLFPLRLNALYSLPQNILAEAAWLVPLWVVLIAALLAIDKKRTATKFGLIWLAVNFVPISNIVPIPSAPMAERYLYLPAIGLWLVAADQAYVLYERFAFKKTLVAAGAAIMICLAMLTVHRNGDWRDNITFFTRMARTNPDSALAHFSLGLAYRERDDIPRARSEWERTAQINPGYFHVFAYLGESYLRTNSFEQAEDYYTREIAEYPDDATAIYNLAHLKEKLNKPREALWYYEQFIGLQPQPDADRLATVTARIAHLRKAAHIK
jgi:tetratricopeptide (TPR) repeat protein